MPNRHTRNRLGMMAAEINAAYMDDREDELLDAAVTAAALIARADGSVEPIERSQMLDVLRRNGLLSVFTRLTYSTPSSLAFANLMSMEAWRWRSTARPLASVAHCRDRRVRRRGRSARQWPRTADAPSYPSRAQRAFSPGPAGARVGEQLQNTHVS